MADKSVLQNVYLFKGLSDNSISKISEISKLSTYSPGDEIFSEGDTAKFAYFIKYGSIKIQHKTKSGELVTVATLGTGSHFGEMAFLDNEKRSATAVAIEKTEIIETPFDKLKSILDEDLEIAAHVYRELSHFLAGRLRVTTNDLSFAREKNLSHF